MLVTRYDLEPARRPVTTWDGVGGLLSGSCGVPLVCAEGVEARARQPFMRTLASRYRADEHQGGVFLPRRILAWQRLDQNVSVCYGKCYGV